MVHIMETLLRAAFVFYGFIFVGFMQRNQIADALQCYVCDKCVEGTELQVMQICGELPIESTLQPSTQSAATTMTVDESSQGQNGSTKATAAPATTVKGSDDDESDSDDDSDDDESEDDDDRRRDRDDIRTVTFAKTTTAAISTIDASSSAVIGEDSYEDDSETSLRILKDSDKVIPKQNVPVCYMIKFQMNGKNLTNLGCTSMVNENEYLTCQSLYPNSSAINDCRLCSLNGCNKFYFNSSNDGDDLDYDYQSAGNKFSFNIFQIFLSLSILKLLL